MRNVTIMFAVVLISGCAFSPPKPKQCEGEFRPVNQSQVVGAASVHIPALALCTKGAGNVQQG
jgi:hypothetical protein